MKKEDWIFLTVLIVSILVFGMSIKSAYCQVSVFRTALIYNKLIAVNHIKNPPRLVVVDNDTTQLPNALYNRKNNLIIINKPLLDIADEDTVATSLGHELAHSIRGDVMVPFMSIEASRAQEQRADLRGKQFTEKAGYNVCKGFKWIKDLDTVGSKDHPDSAIRWKYLGCEKTLTTKGR